MRKFGVEIELNSLDQRDFKKNPLGKDEFPLGIEYVEMLIKNLNYPVRKETWHQTHNNSDWVCKPDSSCGMEICSPVCSDTSSIINLIDKLAEDENIKVDNRCSFHVHFDIEDCLIKNKYKIDIYNSISLASILAWWIKCEAVIFDSFPSHRKLNRYCQCIGMCDIFSAFDSVNCFEVINKLGLNKYYSCNVYHCLKSTRPTIEFRLAEEKACLNSLLASNWIYFLSHFIKCSIDKGLPDSYCWVDLLEIFEFLDFNKNLNLEKIKIRNWFLSRILENTKSEISQWNDKIRNLTIEQSQKILKNLQLDKDDL